MTKQPNRVYYKCLKSCQFRYIVLYTHNNRVCHTPVISVAYNLRLTKKADMSYDSGYLNCG